MNKRNKIERIVPIFTLRSASPGRLTVVEVGLLLLRCVVHVVDLARLLVEWRLLAIDDLLLLLRHVARGAAAGAEAVGAAVAREVIFRANVTTVDHGKDEGDAETG